jgi:transcriptional regulator with XRE-family HTH domain
VTVGYLLKRYRVERGLSQRALGKVARVRPALICELETGKKRDTKSGTLQRLAQALGISLAQLLDQETTLEPLTTPRAWASL